MHYTSTQVTFFWKVTIPNAKSCTWEELHCFAFLESSLISGLGEDGEVLLFCLRRKYTPERQESGRVILSFGLTPRLSQW